MTNRSETTLSDFGEALHINLCQPFWLFPKVTRPLLRVILITQTTHQNQRNWVIESSMSGYGTLESVQKQFLLYAVRKLGFKTFPLPFYNARYMLVNIQTCKRHSFSAYRVSSDVVEIEYLCTLSSITPSPHFCNKPSAHKLCKIWTTKSDDGDLQISLRSY